MAFEIDNIIINSGLTGTTAVLNSSISATTISGTSIFVNTLTQNGVSYDLSLKADISGATFTGQVNTPIISATTGIISNTFSLGTNITSAATLNIVSLSSQTQTALLDQYGGSSNFRFRRGNGSPSSPTALLSGDSMGSLNFGGYNGTGFTTNNARIRGIASENWSTTGNGTTIEFAVIPNGSTNQFTSMTLPSSGGLSATSITGVSVTGNNIFSGNTNLLNIFLTLNSQLTGYTFPNIGSVSAITSGNTILQGFQNLERLIKNFDIQYVASSSSTSTSSTSFVNVPSMSAVTKDLGQSGLYFIFFNSSSQNNTNNRYVGARILINGVPALGSEVYANTGQNNANRQNALSSMVMATLTSGSTIQVQYVAESNTASLFSRTLYILGIPLNYQI